MQNRGGGGAHNISDQKKPKHDNPSEEAVLQAHRRSAGRRVVKGPKTSLLWAAIKRRGEEVYLPILI